MKPSDTDKPKKKPEAWKRTTPEGWKLFSAAMMGQALQGYEDGELDLREVLRWVSACAKECPDQFRRLLLGMTAERALDITPRRLGTRKPAYALCLRNSVANLVIMFQEHGLPVDPSSATGEDAITRAREWLEPLELCKAGLPEHKTIHKWYLDRKRADGFALKPGRRPRSK